MTMLRPDPSGLDSDGKPTLWSNDMQSDDVRDLLTTATEGQAEGRHWKLMYRTRLLAVDSFVVVGAVTLTQIGRFLILTPKEADPAHTWESVTILSAIIAATWLLALGVLQSRDISLVGIGVEEYRRVVSATVWVFGLIAVLSLLLRTEVSRGYLVIALPLGLVGLIACRHLLRRNLAKRRLRGEFLTRVLVLGKPDSIDMLCRSLKRSTHTGYSLAGVCIPDFDDATGATLSTPLGMLPVLGDEHSVEVALRLTGADALVVTAVEHLGHDKMRKLAWRLDAVGVDMIVVPGMMDIAGPRLKLRPIDNLPLFHIERPRFDGAMAYSKRLFDILFAFAALVAVAPVMVAAAIAIKLDDAGPTFFKQVRVGRHGERFHIVKLRTMTVDAEDRKDSERAAVNSGGVFFKTANDSRITQVGRFLRRTSIDELPQLFNVLSGSMSIVGPRPLVPGEGDTVEYFVQHRSLVKPGITGLWQISGRSDVNEEERIRLDHLYVDNWSIVMDLVIVWRTVHAVLKRQGAY